MEVQIYIKQYGYITVWVDYVHYPEQKQGIETEPINEHYVIENVNYGRFDLTKLMDESDNLYIYNAVYSNLN